MTTNLKSDASFWVKNEADVTGNSNTGAATGTATRIAHINPDAGLANTIVAIDGDLRTIDTVTEALATSPVANSNGASSAGYSGNFLFRWLVYLVQTMMGRLPSALGYQNASNALPTLPARPTPTSTSPIATATDAISTVTAVTDTGMVEVDLNGLDHSGYFNVVAEITTNSTAPGTGRTLTVFWAFRQTQLTINAEAYLRLSTREYSMLCPLPNIASRTREYETGVIQQHGRYLYIWYDHSARDASSALTLTVRLNVL